MKKFIIVLILLIVGFALYARFLEPTLLKVNEYNIESSIIPESFDGTKIAHFSDLRYKNDMNMVKKVVKNINKQDPDIVVFTGDLLFQNIDENTKTKLIEELSKITAKEYKYATIGDLDKDISKEILTSSGFIVLDNTSEYIFNGSEKPLLIAGGDNITQEILDKDIEIESNFKIALIHKPDDYKKIKDTNVSLVLAGHSLGGDVILPFWGPLFKREGAKEYIDSHFEKLYVSYGIGTSKYNIRLFNLPSINVYRINLK